jgi:hypothetical protein
LTKTEAKAESPIEASDVATAPHIRAPRRRRPKRLEGTSAILDRQLASTVSIMVNGEKIQVSADQAIILQLLQKAMAGNARAWRALLKYQELAQRRAKKSFEFTFVDSDYTTTFANTLGRDGDG